MPAVEWPVGMPGRRQLLGADQPGQPVQPSRQRQHQRKGVLRACDIGAPAHTEDGDAAGFARRQVDVAKDGAVFVDDPETRRQCELFGSDDERLGHHSVGIREISAQFRLGGHQPDLAGSETPRALPCSLAPGRKIRLVRRHEIGERGGSLRARRRVEHHRDQARPHVVFDDQDGRFL